MAVPDPCWSALRSLKRLEQAIRSMDERPFNALDQVELLWRASNAAIEG